jgi:hypothetical protein
VNWTYDTRGDVSRVAGIRDEVGCEFDRETSEVWEHLTCPGYWAADILGISE